jgi:hypothetical protein
VSDEGSIHPKNAAGPFYVLNGCCTACGVPTAIAPELFEFDSTDHCFVKRQPSSNAEMEKALHVLRGQELGCVRYRGTDEAILRRLAEAGDADQCDHPPAAVDVVLRSVVTFVISDSHNVSYDASRLRPAWDRGAVRFSCQFTDVTSHEGTTWKRVENWGTNRGLRPPIRTCSTSGDGEEAASAAGEDDQTVAPSLDVVKHVCVGGRR